MKMKKMLSLVLVCGMLISETPMSVYAVGTDGVEETETSVLVSTGNPKEELNADDETVANAASDDESGADATPATDAAETGVSGDDIWEDGAVQVEIFYPEEEDRVGIASGLQNYTEGAKSEAEVLRRINELTAVFPSGSYFSVNRQACTGDMNSSTHSCDNCNYLNVMDSLGISKISSLSGAWTCLGFTDFVYYYLFHQFYPSKKKEIIQCAGNEVVQYAIPGDVIKFGGHWVTYVGQKNGLPICYESN